MTFSLFLAGGWGCSPLQGLPPGQLPVLIPPGAAHAGLHLLRGRGCPPAGEGERAAAWLGWGMRSLNQGGSGWGPIDLVAPRGLFPENVFPQASLQRGCWDLDCGS